jgi:hypothetical protein
MPKALIDLHYLPSLEYFCCLLGFDELILEQHEHFVKQSYRSRCYINTSQGPFRLVVPTLENHGKVVMKDVLIDPSIKWRNNHWRTIEAAYRKAPYYEFYSADLNKILYQPHSTLFELNQGLLSFCLRSIGLKVKLSESLSFEKSPNGDVADLRNAVEVKKSHLTRKLYRAVPYTQVFGNSFVENLSLLDLLFCEGPNSLRLIRSSASLLNK